MFVVAATAVSIIAMSHSVLSQCDGEMQECGACVVMSEGVSGCSWCTATRACQGAFDVLASCTAGSWVKTCVGNSTVSPTIISPTTTAPASTALATTVPTATTAQPIATVRADVSLQCFNGVPFVTTSGGANVVSYECPTGYYCGLYESGCQFSNAPECTAAMRATGASITAAVCVSSDICRSLESIYTVANSTRCCATTECNSAPAVSTIYQWQSAIDRVSPTTFKSLKDAAVAGPWEVLEGDTIDVELTSTGDLSLYLNSEQEYNTAMQNIGEKTCCTNCFNPPICWNAAQRSYKLSSKVVISKAIVYLVARCRNLVFDCQVTGIASLRRSGVVHFARQTNDAPRSNAIGQLFVAVVATIVATAA